MATWTTLTFAALEVLAAAKMNQLVANLTALVQEAANIPTWTKATITPASAVVGLTIDQNEDEIGLEIDSESPSQPGLKIWGRVPAQLIQDVSGGKGLDVSRDIAEAGANPLVTFNEDNVASSSEVLQILNDGSGNDLAAPNFSLKAGYIAPGGNEALRWDVVEFDLDGTSTDQVAYTLDGVKCKAMSAIGFDVSLDDVHASTESGVNTFAIWTVHNGTDLVIAYGASYVAGDDGRVIIFTTA